MRLRVGVIIPAYNAEGFIADALDSIRTQTRPADQVTVVDDGSVDATADRIEAWTAAHPEVPVTLLRAFPNRGLSHARNHAIAATSAECVATLDADDLFEPDHLERLMVPLEQNDQVILSFGDTLEFTASGCSEATLLSRVGGALWGLPADDRGEYRVLGGSVFQSLLPGSYVPVSGSVFRRERAIAAGLYDPGLKRVEDRDFMLRMSRTGQFAYVPFVACRKRLHAHNISGPGHHLPMAEGGFGVLLRAREWVRTGPPEDRVAVERELRRAAEVLLYSASVTDLDTTARVAVALHRAGFRSLARSPVSWMRAVWYQVTRKGSRPVA